MSDDRTIPAVAEVLPSGRVRLRMHGRQTLLGADGPVPAAVFAKKLANLVQALRAADRAVNGKITYDYAIGAMAMGSAVIELQGMMPVTGAGGEAPVPAPSSGRTTRPPAPWR